MGGNTCLIPACGFLPASIVNLDIHSFIDPQYPLYTGQGHGGLGAKTRNTGSEVDGIELILDTLL